MFVPEVVFCYLAACYLAAADPTETEERCHERIQLMMLPTLRQTLPSLVVVGLRCRPAVEDEDEDIAL